ncbi:MAG TPA: hypothetical protein DEB39_03830 [Planctomycetaceae bacterium]|nr:hypothetical protein [Planctomycetaceae bacterium]
MLFDEEQLRRVDFCAEVWMSERDKQTQNRIGWWKSRVPPPNEKKLKLAPNDVLLALFDQLSERLDQPELRYVLTLLLIRRRLFRIEKEQDGTLTVYCGKRDTVYDIPAVLPEGEEIDAVQNYLSEMLYA